MIIIAGLSYAVEGWWTFFVVVDLNTIMAMFMAKSSPKKP